MPGDDSEAAEKLKRYMRPLFEGSVVLISLFAALFLCLALVAVSIVGCGEQNRDRAGCRSYRLGNPIVPVSDTPLSYQSQVKVFGSIGEEAVGCGNPILVGSSEIDANEVTFGYVSRRSLSPNGRWIVFWRLSPDWDCCDPFVDYYFFDRRFNSIRRLEDIDSRFEYEPERVRWRADNQLILSGDGHSTPLALVVDPLAG